MTSSPSFPRRWRLVVGVSTLVVLAFVAGGWWLLRGSRTVIAPSGVELGRPLGAVGPGDLNVLVITLDTTRWDRLGAYGDRTAMTPNLDRLASEGVLFEQAIAAVPLTLPSHSTMFTGLLPPRHGVRDNGGYVLDPAHTTLASVLKRDGWQTGAFVGAFVLDGKWGLNQGFDTYVDRFDLAKYKSTSLGDVARRGSEVVDNAMPWLEAHAGQRFFAWLHFYDAHSPYDPPEPYRTQFRDRPYAGEIAYVDDQIGRVLRWLDTRDLTSRTIVIAIGDHGESLNEHGEGTHGLFIYDSTTRVPFIVRAPYASMRGRRVASVVRSEDLMPTILDLVGVRGPQMQGRSLAPLLTGATGDLNLDAYSESFYARNHYGWSELKAFRSGRFKYIEATKPELYDLERDPGEHQNLIAERAPLAERLGAELARLGAETANRGGPSAVDPETRERLAALGYIGTFTQTPRTLGEKLPDPKDKIDIFNLMTSAHESSGKADPHAAIARLTQVVTQDPKVLDAWVMLGNEYFRQRDYPAALVQYKRALDLNPDYDLATINLANTYRALGDERAAIVGYERYLEKDPKNAWVRYQLGELLVDRGDLDQAQAAFEQALSDDTRVAAARTALGVVAFKRGDMAAAETHIRAAIAQKPDVRLAHFNLALIAEQRRQWQTAIAEYQQEIETQAGAFKAAFNLGKLYEQLGDRAAQEAAFRKAIELNPSFAEGHFYLAKLYLDENRELDAAIGLAKKGLELAPASAFAPLGHYVLADIYSRRGLADESRREADKGRALERAGRERPRQGVLN